MNKKLLVLTLLALTIQCALEDYEKDGDVLILYNENIEQAMEEFDHLFVKFYAPWCDHCKEMANDWRETATVMKKQKVQLAELDCTIDHPNKSCQKWVDSGYPTLKFFGRRKKDSKKYDGKREKSGFIRFATDNIDIVNVIKGAKGNSYEELNGSLDLNEYNYKNALGDFKNVFVQYYKDCAKCSVYESKWKRVSSDVKKLELDDIVTARVNCSEEGSLCEGITKFPKLVMYREEQQVAEHVGKADTKQLVDFVSKNVQKKTKDDL